MTSSRAAELRSLSSREEPARGWKPAAAGASAVPDPGPTAGAEPPSGPDPRALRRGAWVALGLALAAVAVVAVGFAVPLPAAPTWALALVLGLAARAAPLAVHGAHLRALRRAGEGQG